MNKRDSIKQKFAYIALLAICFMIFNNIFFMHWHHLENGKIIVHAHPYNKFAEKSETNPKHSHNSEEIALIAILNTALISILIVLYSFVNYYPHLKKHNFVLNYSLHEQRFLSNLMARPPPR
jgi:heme/copper-type cytochrome/quinol oxidase subunit 4